MFKVEMPLWLAVPYAMHTWIDVGHAHASFQHSCWAVSAGNADPKIRDCSTKFSGVKLIANDLLKDRTCLMSSKRIDFLKYHESLQYFHIPDAYFKN